MTAGTGVDPAVLRQVCGHWATGVAVVTATAADGTPLGMAVNSFTSLSLDPPLILFCPALTSTTWPGIRATGRFAVDILATQHSALARSFARSGGDKFAGVTLRPTDDGLPAIDGAAARLVCDINTVHPGGDHEIVVGRVLHAEHSDGSEPLLFHRGRTPGYRFV
ncbi:NADH-FMN oxidoreductase RutF, flavin reductase (DIM6/NTAB) family [Pseudonocardia ammonioxydans]|uniref:NADH-FMN oxidoreductase RutF, flavin reductase (DIM6/NTAB) family n=1 Tax=Pseudonocardia ammonioxydans TaxID=260086 RepID=A0A1I4XVL9_PSUAM|nr:flavin reductase family protein [Pseudonocardia ammonioxydans]SFN29807.1 NADH-FMN oxidoreductase RutF, flavin reductase (DIM6/NTAB) family [Pseudonocardia ammonioxydans]